MRSHITVDIMWNGLKRSDVDKEAMRARMKARWQDPIYRAKMQAAQVRCWERVGLERAFDQLLRFISLIVMITISIAVFLRIVFYEKFILAIQAHSPLGDMLHAM